VSGLADIEAHNLAEPGDVLVVQGAVRDIDHSRRIETMAVNHPVHIAGIEVKPGDLVIADECGVCFVPFARAAEVFAVAQRMAASEAQRLKKLDEGIPLADFVKLPR
jgi:regulator of RNase E activity RraA